MTEQTTRRFHITVKEGAHIYKTNGEDAGYRTVKRAYQTQAVMGRYGIWYFKAKDDTFSVDYKDITVESEVK